METIEQQRDARPRSPGYRLVRVGPAVLVRLDAAPTPASVACLASDVTRARADAGCPIVYVSLIPRDATIVPAEVRPLMSEFARHVSGVSASVHLVIEKPGFGGTILRSAVTAIAMATRERNLTVYSSFDDAMDRLRRVLDPDDATALEQAARGFGAGG